MLLAPRNKAILSILVTDRTARIIEKIVIQQLVKEKVDLALSRFFCPSNTPIIVCVPTANIIAIAKSELTKGIAMFTAESASSPTKLATKKPSTIVYREKTSIATIDGMTK